MGVNVCGEPMRVFFDVDHLIARLIANIPYDQLAILVLV
jgi:hypothetical protein